jgi:hypothetical protein
MSLLEQWRDRLQRFNDRPEIAKGMDSRTAMGVQHGRLTALKECIRELEQEQMSEVLAHARLGMTRSEVIAVLGKPQAEGGTSRKYPTPSIFKYGDIELHFQPWKDGVLCVIWDEANEKVIETI